MKTECSLEQNYNNKIGTLQVNENKNFHEVYTLQIELHSRFSYWLRLSFGLESTRGAIIF